MKSQTVALWILVAVVCTLGVASFVLIWAQRTEAAAGLRAVCELDPQGLQRCRQDFQSVLRIADTLATDSALNDRADSLVARLARLSTPDRAYFSQVCALTGNIMSKASLLISFVGILFVVINVVIAFWSKLDFDRQRREFKEKQVEYAKLFDDSRAALQKEDTQLRGLVESKLKEEEGLMENHKAKLASEGKRTIEALNRVSQDYKEYVGGLTASFARFLTSRTPGLLPAFDREVAERVLFLYSGNFEMTREAIWFLAERGTRGVISYLDEVVRTNPSPELQQYARDAIRDIRRREGVQDSSQPATEGEDSGPRGQT